MSNARYIFGFLRALVWGWCVVLIIFAVAILVNTSTNGLDVGAFKAWWQALDAIPPMAKLGAGAILAIGWGASRFLSSTMLRVVFVVGVGVVCAWFLISFAGVPTVSLQAVAFYLLAGALGGLEFLRNMKRIH